MSIQTNKSKQGPFCHQINKNYSNLFDNLFDIINYNFTWQFGRS